MKIGILTYHAVCNFGANLQVLSTFYYLKNRGDEPVVINWMPKVLEDSYKHKTPEIQFKIHEDFRNKYLVLTKRCYTTEDVAKVINEENIDAVIVGSDAVAQHHPIISRISFPTKKVYSYSHIGEDRKCPNPFWGNFLSLLDKKIPLAMMSVSCQNSAYKTLMPFERKLLLEHVDRFNYISTRDSWTSDMFKYITCGKLSPKVTPDPVFAFNANFKDQIPKSELLKKFKLLDKYILFSFHDSKTVSFEWLSEFKKVAFEKGFICVALPFPNGITFSHPFDYEISLPLSPLEWYGLIKYSSGYVGHNMHPIVVSLHNSVPCFSFDNYGILKFRVFLNEKSSKIYHILRQFDLLSNRTSAFLKNKKITPLYVLDKLLTFNKSKTSELSREYLNLYYRMMENIIDTFKN